MLCVCILFVSILSTSRDHPIHLWDVSSGTLRCTYRAYDHLVREHDRLYNWKCRVMTLERTELLPGVCIVFRMS